MKAIEKWLLKPFIQRLVYALLLLLCLYISNSRGSFNHLSSFTAATAADFSSVLLVLVPVLLLSAQLIWNRQWLWFLLCALLIGFTLWLATLSLQEIAIVTGARAVVWYIGIIGFSILLIFIMAFANWILLHMKPKK